MKVFQDKQTGVKIGLSFKVMFLFFMNHPRFIHDDRLVPDLFLARNPFDRAVSTFFEKCRARVREPYFQKPQDAQVALMGALRVKSVEALLGISFGEFCRVLPMVIDKDAHFIPQSAYPLPSRIVQIETGLPSLGKELDLDFTEKVNATDHLPACCYLDRESAEIIRTLYADDFVKLGYSTEIYYDPKQ